jgi:hypothetical protein
VGGVATLLHTLQQTSEFSTLGEQAPVVDRDKVIDLVGDTNRMLYYGGDNEAYEAVDGWDNKVELLKGAFPLSAMVDRER